MYPENIRLFYQLQSLLQTATFRAMTTLVNIYEELMQVDEQIIRLLEERSQLAQRGTADPEQEADVASLWLEEAADRGLDEQKMERIAKLVSSLSWGSRE